MKSITQQLQIAYPIIQAPMAGVQDSTLAISVSNSGALGSLPCAMLNNQTLHKELKKIKENTSNPVNLNFFCHTLPEEDIAQQEKWKEILQPYFEELGISTHEVASGPSRLPFNQDHIDILKEFKPSILSFHFGLPNQALLNQVKEWGAKIISSATTLEEALWLEQHGADIIIAQGIEAGGHRGMFLTTNLSTQKGTFALLPQIVNQVSVPVIATGGIADSAGIRAARELGASGFQLGTSYLLCHEALTSPIHRAALTSKEALHTALTNIFTGRPARGIVNKIMKELGTINLSVPNFPYASSTVNALRQAAEKNNSGDFSPLWAGENTSGCKPISAKELTLELINGL